MWVAGSMCERAPGCRGMKGGRRVAPTPLAAGPSIESGQRRQARSTPRKNGRSRRVDLTNRLLQALRENRHARGPRVLWRDPNYRWDAAHAKAGVWDRTIQSWMERIRRRAGCVTRTARGSRWRGHRPLPQAAGGARQHRHDGAVNAPRAELPGEHRTLPREPKAWKHSGIEGELSPEKTKAPRNRRAFRSRGDRI